MCLEKRGIMEKEAQFYLAIFILFAFFTLLIPNVSV
jgi:hypothetical protein